MSSFSLNTNAAGVEFKAAQWKLEIDAETGKAQDVNLQTAVVGPKAGQQINAFFTLEIDPATAYGAPRFIQEPDLAFPITVREPVMKDGLFQFDAAGEMVTTLAAKRLVGFILINPETGASEGRGSWSNLAVFAKKDYNFDAATGVLRIEGQYYRLAQTIEADKNRMDGVAGTFIKIKPEEAQGLTASPVINYELGIVAALIMPTNSAMLEALRATWK